MRKLVTIRRITDVIPIPDTDNLVLITVDGWQVIGTRSQEFKPGDFCFYFEIDSFLPVRPEFEFLRSRCFKSTKNLGDGFRLRTIKLKGCLSQGLVTPLKDFGFTVSEYGFFAPDGTCFTEEDDLSTYFSVQLYEKPIPSNLAGKVRGNFPSFIRKTDQERIQNFFGKVVNSPDIFEMTTKLDGASMTVYVNNGAVGVCSRNLDLYEEETNKYWQIARTAKLIEKISSLNLNIAIQGELYGQGVGTNPDKLNNADFHLFDVWDIDTQSYYDSNKRIELAKELDIQHVPVLGYFSFSDKLIVLSDILEMANNVKSLAGRPGEGIVFKSVSNPSFSFKAISNTFLLKEKD